MNEDESTFNKLERAFSAIFEESDEPDFHAAQEILREIPGTGGLRLGLYDLEKEMGDGFLHLSDEQLRKDWLIYEEGFKRFLKLAKNSDNPHHR